MLQDAFASLIAEVQSVVRQALLLKLIDHPQALRVVLKAQAAGVCGANAIVERMLSGVPKWGVSEVMRERNHFAQVFVEPQGSCN